MRKNYKLRQNTVTSTEICKHCNSSVVDGRMGYHLRYCPRNPNKESPPVRFTRKRSRELENEEPEKSTQSQLPSSGQCDANSASHLNVQFTVSSHYTDSNYQNMSTIEHDPEDAMCMFIFVVVTFLLFYTLLNIYKPLPTLLQPSLVVHTPSHDIYFSPYSLPPLPNVSNFLTLFLTICKLSHSLP